VAKEVDIPGTDVENLGNLLGQVIDAITKKHYIPFEEQSVGRPMVAAGQNFDGKWSDGRKNLQRQCQHLKEACDQIVKAFTDVDNQAADQLKGNNS
jgi:hypothetical protein